MNKIGQQQKLSTDQLAAFKMHLKEGLKGEINIDELSDDELQALALAYIIDENKEDGDYDDEEQHGDSDVDDLDFNNFKGIYFNDDPNRKYQDPSTGCHFEYLDLCKRLIQLKELRREIDKELGIPISPHQIQQSASQQLKAIQEIKYEEYAPKTKPLQTSNDQEQIKSTNSNKKQPQPILKLFKNQIKEVPGAFYNQQQKIQNYSISQVQLDENHHQNNPQLNDIKDRILVATGGQGSAPNKGSAFRSKSFEKATSLLPTNNPEKVIAQYSHRGNQLSNANQLSSLVPSQVYNGVHQKQISLYSQVEAIQRGMSQGGPRKSNPNTGSIVEMPSKMSIMSTSKNEGTKNHKRTRADAASSSFALNQFKNQRTIEGYQPSQFYHIQQPSQQNMESAILGAIKHQKGRQSQSIYIDNIPQSTQMNRQFRNSNFQSAKTSAVKKNMINQSTRNQKQSIDQLKLQLLNAGTRNNFTNGINNIANTVYGNLVATGQTQLQSKKSRNQAASYALPQSLSINYTAGQNNLMNQNQPDYEKMSPYFIKMQQPKHMHNQSSKMTSKQTLGLVDIDTSGIITKESHSRNNHQQSMKSQELLMGAQRQNNMLIRPNGMQIDHPTSKSKRIITANHQFRKSFGGAAYQGVQPQHVNVGIRDSQSRDQLAAGRPITQGKIGVGSIITNQNVMNMLGHMNNQIMNVAMPGHSVINKNDRSRQKQGNGLQSQLPTQQTKHNF